MNLMGLKSVYDLIWTGYQSHLLKEDPAEIVYPCQIERSSRATKQNGVVNELKLFVDSEIPKTKPTDQRQTGKKRSQRSKNVTRSMLIVFLDEMDALISKASLFVNRSIVICFRKGN